MGETYACFQADGKVPTVSDCCCVVLLVVVSKIIGLNVLCSHLVHFVLTWGYPQKTKYHCSVPYAYIGPFAYGTSLMRLIWDVHTRMGHFVSYKYLHVLFLYRSLDTAAINK